MAHPYQNVRQSKVERSRVGSLTKGYASGGAVNASATELARSAKALATGGAVAMTGKAPKARLDRPGRATGGRTNGKGATVNIIVGGGDKPPMPPLAGLGMPPPMPPPPPPIPPGPPPGGPPMGMPPGGPPPGIRSMGGRAYAKGGRVKSGPAYEEGKRAGTQVSHTPGKNDLQELNRGKPITYADGGPANPATKKPKPPLTPRQQEIIDETERQENFSRYQTYGGQRSTPDSAYRKAGGGPVEAPKNGMGPKLGGGGRGGLARLQKAARAKGKR